ncbi:citryl-CoA lyase [Methylobacterium platani]|uniref:citrate synthase (unknown stereospecificity) n=2 Tax=Methylobacterium platani TaxID=427683 RepID=A0A179RYU0_9HYPH|nr:citryl-CoA lyase [Methylobacterium platani]KMO14871.1 citrate synthase [Methylobacterium platani JCM 14648]OAS16198.1 citryl-CoA lyase [Methylobacterium platani]
MARTPKPIRSDIAWSTSDRITVRGKSLPDEILGHINLGDMAFLQLTGRMPTPQQSAVFNAVVITLVEHGITPSAIAARMTYAGAPESLQAAVAAGLCGLGTVFVGSMEGAARLLYEIMPEEADADLDAVARETVARYRAEKRILPGFGHPIHKPVDPRTPRLFAIAAENGMAGRYVDLIQRIHAEAERASGKPLTLNATGALGALCCEFGFPWRIVRGFGVMARAIGLVGHILEEAENPMAIEIWQRIEDEASSHMRPA